MAKFELKLKSEHKKPVTVDKLHDATDEESIGWRYTKQAILYMDAVARSNQAKFIIAPIIISNTGYHEILKKFADEHHLLFIENLRVYEWDRTHFLPNDGHFNVAGAKAMAELILGYLRANYLS